MSIQLKVYESKDLKSIFDSMGSKKIHAAFSLFLEQVTGKVKDASPRGVFGALSGSWSWKVTMTDKMVRGVIRSSSPYAHFIINGSKPHSKNPGFFLRRWVEKVVNQNEMASKIGMTQKQIEKARSQKDKSGYSKLTVSLAFLIGRAKMKKGYKGHDFVKVIFEEDKPVLDKLLGL